MPYHVFGLEPAEIPIHTVTGLRFLLCFVSLNTTVALLACLKFLLASPQGRLAAVCLFFGLLEL
jgi:hypothetical protein